MSHIAVRFAGALALSGSAAFAQFDPNTGQLDAKNVEWGDAPYSDSESDSARDCDSVHTSGTDSNSNSDSESESDSDTDAAGDRRRQRRASR